MNGQISLDGIADAPPPLHLQVALIGMLWQPARVLEADLAMAVWVKDPSSALPVFALLQSPDIGRLNHLEQQLQRIGTPVLVRGYGLGLAVVENRECLRIGHVQHIGLAPAIAEAA